MGFTIAEVLAKLLLGWGLNQAEVLEQAEKIKAQYPDLAPRIDAFEAWLRDRLAGVLDVERFTATIRGIAADVMSGMSGLDADAWRGSV